jgi:hypothetical protein
VLAGWAWVWPWARTTIPRPSVLPLVLLLAAGLALLLLSRRRPADPAAARPLLATLGAAAASVLFWFLSAPDPRFGYGPLYVLAVLPLAAALPRLGYGAWSGAVRAVLAAAVACGFAGAGVAFLVMGAGFRPAALVPPAPPSPAIEERRTDEGETVRIPVTDDRCWSAPIPCTPHFRSDLLIERDDAGRARVFSFPPGGSAETRDRQPSPK